ncbi:Serpentine Receptor class T [Trichostrongylus colubriformis]|uniref:Serpentine Receptor class T n=1 Tax=Trichostrongylus colubriformis TaxID=6319 RepID=A0AAN8IA16_TRICO
MEVPTAGGTPLSDIIVGCCMMLLSLACACAYSFILVMLWRDDDLMKMPSYKLMFTLGVFDVIQCVPHFVTGIFTILQSVGNPILAKAMGVLATPAYVAYTVLTVVLSLNRFLQIYSPRLDSILFSAKGVNNWIGFSTIVWFLFACALSSPWAAILYLPNFYSWEYDYELSYSWLVQRTEMVIELGTILVSALFYILVIIALYRTRKRFMAKSNSHTEMKILIQALVITVYCTVLNFLWHNSQRFLPLNIWTYMTLNMMWILNSGVYPIIYFIVNRVIRQKFHTRRVHTHEKSIITKHPHKSSSDEPKCKISRVHFDGNQKLGDVIKNNTKVQILS